VPNGRELHLYDVDPGDTCIPTSGWLRLGREQIEIVDAVALRRLAML